MGKFLYPVLIFFSAIVIIQSLVLLIYPLDLIIAYFETDILLELTLVLLISNISLCILLYLFFINQKLLLPAITIFLVSGVTVWFDINNYFNILNGNTPSSITKYYIWVDILTSTIYYISFLIDKNSKNQKLLKKYGKLGLGCNLIIFYSVLNQFSILYYFAHYLSIFIMIFMIYILVKKYSDLNTSDEELLDSNLKINDDN